MAIPPRDKSLQGLLKDHDFRIALVERRLGSGVIISGGGGDPSAPLYDALPGMVMPYAGASPPDGWLLCDGAAVSRTDYSALFSTIGTSYGTGNGTTTFNLPNLKGRVPVGQDAGQAEFDVRGETGGAKVHTLTVEEMPAHAHDTQWAYNGAGPDGARIDISRSGGAGAVTGSTQAGVQIKNAGGGLAHNNLQPYVVTNYIISTGKAIGGGGAPSTDAVIGRATMSANATTPATGGTFFTVNWSAYTGHPGVWSSAAPGRFVLAKPGQWRVTGKIRMLGATSGYGVLVIWKNGVSVDASEDLRTTGVGGSYPASQDIITSDGTTYVEFRAVNSDASQQVVALNSLVTLEWIGA